MLADWLPDGRLMAVEAPIAHPAAPPPGKRVRADVFGGYTLQDRADGGVLWTIFAEADVGGFVPTRLVDKHVEKIAGWFEQINAFLDKPAGRQWKERAATSVPAYLRPQTEAEVAMAAAAASTIQAATRRWLIRQANDETGEAVDVEKEAAGVEDASGRASQLGEQSHSTLGSSSRRARRKVSEVMHLGPGPASLGRQPWEDGTAWTWVDLVGAIKIKGEGPMMAAHAAYVLELTTAAAPPAVWRVERRYRQFEEFHRLATAKVAGTLGARPRGVSPLPIEQATVELRGVLRPVVWVRLRCAESLSCSCRRHHRRSWCHRC